MYSHATLLSDPPALVAPSDGILGVNNIKSISGR